MPFNYWQPNFTPLAPIALHCRHQTKSHTKRLQVPHLPIFTLYKNIALTRVLHFSPSAISVCHLNTINSATPASITPCKLRKWRVCHVDITDYKTLTSMMVHDGSSIKRTTKIYQKLEWSVGTTQLARRYEDTSLTEKCKAGQNYDGFGSLFV